MTASDQNENGFAGGAGAGPPKSRTLWFGPVTLLFTFVVLFGAVLWLVNQNADRYLERELAVRAQALSESLGLRLKGNQDYLLLLAAERSSGTLDAVTFQTRASRYVADHPELINITWVDANYQIIDVAPLAGNRQILGLKLNLPEPKRASQLARERRSPVFTRPFEAIQGKSSFELWVPVFRGDTFLGLFAGVFSCDMTLRHLIPPEQAKLNQVSLVDAAGKVLCELPASGYVVQERSRQVPLTPAESGVMLRLSGYRQAVIDWRLLSLELLCLALVLGICYVLWNLKREIEERKIAGRELSQSEERYRHIVESSHDWTWETDAQGNWVFASAQLYQILGYTAAEVLGKSPCHLMPEAEADRYRSVFQELLQRLAPFHDLVSVNLHKDGHTVILESNGVPHFDAGGDFIGYRGTARDVTEQRNLEEQLRQAQKMEAIGHLAGGVAHDFNNILQVINGYSSLIEMTMAEDDGNRARIKEVIAAADRAAQLTRSLLAFSRKQVINPQVVDLNRVVQNVCSFIKRIIGEEIEFETRLHVEPLTVYADSTQIEQVLMNLATNARDAMPGGGSLSVATEIVEMDEAFVQARGFGKVGSYAVVSATDTGSGMEADTLKRLFDPFFTTKEVGKGTGLGLSVVYGIVKQHNGYVTVESEPGRGSTFSLYLPRLDGGCEASRLVPGQSPRAHGNETILVVEDDPAVRKVVVSVLRNFGYQVLVAEDGQQAVATFSEHCDSVSLVLMDMIMPRMSGKQAYDAMRRLKSGVKVLFSSGYTADMIKHRGELDEGAELIVKPVQPHELIAKIRQLLDA